MKKPSIVSSFSHNNKLQSAKILETYDKFIELLDDEFRRQVSAASSENLTNYGQVIRQEERSKIYLEMSDLKDKADERDQAVAKLKSVQARNTAYERVFGEIHTLLKAVGDDRSRGIISMMASAMEQEYTG